MAVTHDGLEIDWLGYATIRLESPESPVVYLDPGRHGALDSYSAKDGDLVFVTHNHHYDPDGIDRVANSDATVVVFDGVDVGEITGRDAVSPEELPYEVEYIGESEEISIDGVSAETVPAYNFEDGEHLGADGDPMHPPGFGVGYTLEIDGVSVFWPGDSDAIPEFESIETSVFLPPIGGTFTMDRHQAAALTRRLEPALTIPVHYDTFPEIETDAEAFLTDVASSELPVVLSEPE